MPDVLPIISASCQVLSFVLLMVMFSADSDKYGRPKNPPSPTVCYSCLLDALACFPHQQVVSPGPCSPHPGHAFFLLPAFHAPALPRS